MRSLLDNEMQAVSERLGSAMEPVGQNGLCAMFTRLCR